MNKFCVISIYVNDIGLAKAFYCEKLGFELSEEYDPATVSLKHESIPIVLCEVKSVSTSVYPYEAQVVLGIQTGNLLESTNELLSKGVKFIYDTPQPCPPGLYNAFKDPFGNVIELLEFTA
ncbi:VOC family protein [Paenibacillus sp. UMB4589-SE434]|uniref:VOC family protein n=1 Tax=Paenibacillus sp. UMB4589-SE434 TaxID=3046314 RepID=UPI00254D9206|nr:VOC family protein [Paenibacillus sp. UMB4589-SE434]MDK8179632.1 VOC family protein [Paenibacillus sp. UMB4589-SE434]